MEKNLLTNLLFSKTDFNRGRCIVHKTCSSTTQLQLFLITGQSPMSYPVSCNQNTELSWADNSHLTIIKKAQPDLKKLQKQRSLEFNVRTKVETGRKKN